MAYNHGISASEIATSIIPPVQTNAGLPVVVGTAPIHLATNSAGANKPVLCYSYAEAVAALGYSDDWGKYTLCEFMYSHFRLFEVAPVVFINVLNPAEHKKEVTNKSVSLVSGKGTISEDGILLATLEFRLTAESAALTKNTDYTAAFDSDGNVLITRLATGTIPAEQTTLIAKYTKTDPSMVTTDDIIGGVDVSTGDLEGLELVSRVYPLFQLVPGQMLAPGFSSDPEVAAIMNAKAGNINGVFKATTLTDIPSDEAGIKQYTQAPAWKSTNNFVDPQQTVCWPMVALGSKKYHLSTQVAGINCQKDAENDDVPYESPSNLSLQANACITASGKEINLDLLEANYLNGQGILTALNWNGGWKAWGNRTGAYPSNTDIKDAYIPVRRMFNWIANTLILTHWQKVDRPMNRRLIEILVGSANVWLNGLAGQGFILGGRVAFLKEENPTTDLLNGSFRIHYYVAPPPPGEHIDEVLEYDVSYFNTLFG